MPRPSPARDRIVRHLLGSSARGVRLPQAYATPISTTFELARRTGVTTSWVYKTVEEFQSHGWLRVVDGLEVSNPHALYAWWKQNRTQPRIQSFHVQDPRLAAQQLQAAGIATALTTYYAENVHQGHLFPRRGDAYVRLEDLPRARILLVKEFDAQLGGTNFRLFAGDDGVLEERVEEEDGQLGYAPFPQVVLDLLTEGGSAAEAAEMLIQKAYPHARPRLL